MSIKCKRKDRAVTIRGGVLQIGPDGVVEGIVVDGKLRKDLPPETMAAIRANTAAFEVTEDVPTEPGEPENDEGESGTARRRTRTAKKKHNGPAPETEGEAPPEPAPE